MPHISIDNSSCIRCKKCIKVCPALIFEWDETKKEVALTKSTNCIVCGHCAAVCPTASVKHQNFPPEKVHRIDHQNLPNSEKMMLLCKSRRSSRVFTKDDIEITLLQQIAEAAHRAPTASNQQEVAFTLVTNKEKLKEIIDFTVDTFEQMIKPLQHPLLKPILKRTKPQFYRYIPLVKRMKKEVEAGNDQIGRAHV